LSSKALPSICFYTFFNAHQMMNNVELSNDGSTIVGCFQDSTVRLWDVKKVDSQRVTGAGDIHSLNASTCFLGHSGPVYAASLTNSNNPLLLLTASEDRTVRLWDCSETKSSLVCYRGHNYPVWDVSFSSLSFFFATASHDRTARLWATDRIYPVRIFVGHLFEVNCVRFHPNCNAIATGSNDRSVRLWDINSGRTVRIFSGHYGAINCLALSPDGKTIAAAGEDHSILVWDLATSKRIATFEGHTKSIWSLDFSQESSILASGSADETVKLWNCSPQSGSVVLEDQEMDIDNASERKKVRPLGSFSTKQTSVFKVKFTRRNLLLATGPFNPLIESEPKY